MKRDEKGRVLARPLPKGELPLTITLLEMSRKIRRLQRLNSQLRVSRNKWMERARAAERRVR